MWTNFVKRYQDSVSFQETKFENAQIMELNTHKYDIIQNLINGKKNKVVWNKKQNCIYTIVIEGRFDLLASDRN